MVSPEEPILPTGLVCVIRLGDRGATADNNAVGASARYARSGVHGAYGTPDRGRV
jgi:hypothetical protein